MIYQGLRLNQEIHNVIFPPNVHYKIFPFDPWKLTKNNFLRNYH